MSETQPNTQEDDERLLAFKRKIMDLCVMQTFTDFKEGPTKTYHNY